MTYPPIIPDTWQYSGDWFGCYRLIAKDQELIPTLPASKDIPCPICEYPEAVHLSKFQHDFPLHYWCPACETVWQWYVAKCPDCDGPIWKKGCTKGTVKCTMCDMEMEEELVQDINSLPEFHNETVEEAKGE